jgi:DDB1- and CUL4-associated factor 6
MKYTLADRLLRREVGTSVHKPSLRGLYGDVEWVHNLDIVNELQGHYGCVNALR